MGFPIFPLVVAGGGYLAYKTFFSKRPAATGTSLAPPPGTFLVPGSAGAKVADRNAARDLRAYCAPCAISDYGNEMFYQNPPSPMGPPPMITLTDTPPPPSSKSSFALPLIVGGVALWLLTK